MGGPLTIKIEKRAMLFLNRRSIALLFFNNEIGNLLYFGAAFLRFM